MRQIARGKGDEDEKEWRKRERDENDSETVYIFSPSSLFPGSLLGYLSFYSSLHTKFHLKSLSRGRDFTPTEYGSFIPPKNAFVVPGIKGGKR